MLGGYYYRQHYQQPVYTENGPNLGNDGQPQWNGPYGIPGFFCAQTGGVCASQDDYRRFDNRPSVTNVSYAAFGQVDYKVLDTLKLTGGVRYSHDEKYGSESVRLLCFAVPACLAAPEVVGPFTPAVDLTQLGTVVDNGSTPAQGVNGPTTYNPATGFATRYYDADWQAVTGTAGIEWTPDSDTLAYFKYSRGYKSGGYNIGIFTVLSFFPYTAAEHVNSFELGYKKTWFRTFTTDIALFDYNYTNLQIPITIVGTAGGLTQAATAFYNVPTATSRGAELEMTWQPTRNWAFLFNYSYLDAFSRSGAITDYADPDAIEPGATPLPCTPQTPCTPDTFTGGQQRFQSLNGNRLPNAPRNKIAFNGNYTFFFTPGTLNASFSYIWRDTQEGTLFTRSYNTAPAWDEIDARVTWTGANGRYKIILFGKNLANTIGYDAGAYGTRVVGINNNAAGVGTVLDQGIGSTYSVTPPRTYGIEVDYKFF